ncbi:coiled-coil domain-containing protein 15 [Hyla sarda]|uniref:coiled-coil domain-containing protein 15 n=1 Tax=Hyla sarda TaxID=327740 RepID=UPI0024C2B24B|nr:coiled-coil domain-containing protein 15 [Hyla sarda]
MAPPVQRPVRGRVEPGRVRTSTMVVNRAVLAERNPGRVAAVGAWIEPGDPAAGGRAWVPAEQIEEQWNHYQREKEQRLIRFQGEVKRRVNQHAKQCRSHQFQKSYDAVTREGVIVKQSSDAAMPFTPKRNTCSYRNKQVAICSPRKHWVSAQKIFDDSDEDLEEGDKNGNKLFLQHAKVLKNTMRQVRGRLAALKTVEAEELTLPGGIWKVSPTRDNPVSRRSPVLHSMEAGEDDLPLWGHHDLPVEQLSLKPQGQLIEKENSFPSGKHVCNRLMKESYPAGPAPVYNTDYRAALVLRPGVDEEEERKQRQNQYLMYRRLFMNIEREQVKETRRQKEHERKISKIKREREAERLMEEQQLRLSSRPSILRQVCELEDTEKEATEEKEKAQKAKKSNRYVEALRAQMKDKLLLHNIELPPLCCCGSDFWDSHPDTCANNCIFYQNPKAYTRALQSVLLSRDMWDGSSGSRFSACNISFAQPRALLQLLFLFSRAGH